MNALNSTRERRHGSPAGAITRQLIAEMKELRDLDPATGAREVLAHHPEWAGHKQLLRDLACEEFSQRLAAGEALNAEEFGARFPGCGDSLLEILVTRQFFDENPEFLEDDEGQSWPEAGDMLLGFALIRELGRGAFARVFLAREPALGDRLVVVKVSLLDGSVEADTLGSLAHPNIVPVHSLCADDDTGWTVVCMPYHGSATLEDVLAHLARQPRLPERADVFLEVAEAVDGGWWMVDGAEAHGPRPVGLHPSSPSTEEEPAAILRGGSYLEGVLHLGSQMADALAHVHERRIYHRDLKPANVLLTPAGQPMLLDFNLSCNEEVGEQALGGTLPYMAPEQIQAMSERDARDQDAIGPRADLFALGVLLYELLTGKHPFGPLPRKNDRKALAAYLLDRQRSGPTPLRQLNPRVDRGIARLVEGCLAFDPEQRPASARLLAETLRGRLSAGQRLKRRVASHPWLLAAVAAGVLLVAGLFAALQLTPQARNARDLQAARQAYARGDNTGALQCFTQIIERGGESAAVRFERGRALFRLRRLPEAHAEYLKADKLAGGNDGKIKAALAYTSTTHLGGGHEVAIYYYDNAIKAEFKTAQVYNNLGWSLAQRNLRTEAREFFTRAIQADPTLQVAYHNRLLLTVRQGADQGSDPQRWKATLHEGLADFDKAMQLGPVTADLYRNGARLCSLGVASDPTLAQRGLRYVARAIEHGILPKDLREDRLLTMGLGHLPRFWDLVDGPPSGRAHVLCRFTVDPLE